MSIYFDNAATSHPKPQSVVRAVQRALTETNANPGRSGHRAALEAARTVLNARERLAGLLGAEDPMSVVHCFNCTDALNLAIKGSLKPGDHVVATQLEHNSVLRVLGTLAAMLFFLFLLGLLPGRKWKDLLVFFIALFSLALSPMYVDLSLLIPLAGKLRLLLPPVWLWLLAGML